MIVSVTTTGFRFRLAAALILGVGLVASAILYVVADPDESAASNFQVINGKAFPVDSSRDMRQLERMGGKTLVQLYVFRRWFAGLWKGQTLAFTLAALSVVICLLCWYLGGLADETKAQD